ncbi:hypothetical protein COCNU_10G008060 [Cocos nucifera]|uniref:Uncharacterized protein n=1 Tax=Cocos nucifera TaxID=13894 RepID=A0A8K0IN20_COCNU|nr:hypothetical protein COCNU_10G008060 [Cocos nucifera]
MGIPEIALEVEIPPTVEFDLAADVADPPMPLSPPTKIQISEPSLERKKEAGKKRIKRALRKFQQKLWIESLMPMSTNAPEIRLDPFSRSVEIKVLQEALCKEKVILMGLKTTLDLEEEQKKRDEVETAELKEQISMQISKAAAQAIEKFKISSKMRDLNAKFGHEAFNKGYELCEERVANKFPKLDLNFLYERASEEVVDPSITATDLQPIELASTTPLTLPALATIEGPAPTEAAPDSSTIFLEV